MNTRPLSEKLHYSYNLTDEDMSVIGDLVYARNPEDPPEVETFRARLQSEWEAGRVTLGMLEYVLLCAETTVKQEGARAPFSIRRTHKGFAKRMWREIWHVREGGEANARS